MMVLYYDHNNFTGLDYQLEHENRIFKDQLKSYRGEFTQPHLDRISKGRSRLRGLNTSVDQELNYHRGSGRSRRDLSKADVKTLVDRYSTADIMSNTPARTMPQSLFLCPSNPISMSGMELFEWLDERLIRGACRTTYRQFQLTEHEVSSSSDTEQNLTVSDTEVITWSSDDDL